MIDDSFIVWTIPPDWNDPDTETLEFLTGVMVSITGAEQRQKLRRSPRRFFEFTVRPQKEYRAYFDALLSRPDQLNFYLPVWHEFERTATDATEGATSILVPGTKTELAASTMIFIQGIDGVGDYELQEISSVDVGGNSITFNLVGTLGKAWPRGTRIYPCVPAILAEQPTYNRLMTRILESTIKFQVTAPNDWAGTVTLPTYRDSPVFVLPVNDGDTQTGGYDRLTVSLDNQLGIMQVADLGGIPFQKFGSTTFFHGYVNNEFIRSLLYTMQGRLAPAWFVYPMEDFYLAAAAAEGDTTLTVRRNGFVDIDPATPVAGRQDIQILLRDGTTIYARLTGGAHVDSTTDILTVDTEMPSGFLPTDVDRISFMGFGRLDQDSFDLVHQTDSDGVCGVSISIKAVPDLRDATDWTVAPLPRPAEGACGSNGFWLRLTVDGFTSEWFGSGVGDPSLGINGLDLSAFFEFEGVGEPAYPAVGCNTGDDMGDTGIRFNFGASPFTQPAPFAAIPYGSDVTLNPDDKGAGIGLTSDHLEAFVGPDSIRNFVRATKGTDTQSGLRYFEITFNNVPSISVNFGFMVKDAALVAPSGDVTNGAYLFAFPGYYMPGSVSGVNAIAPGTIAGIAIFTKTPPPAS